MATNSTSRLIKSDSMDQQSKQPTSSRSSGGILNSANVADSNMKINLNYTMTGNITSVGEISFDNEDVMVVRTTMNKQNYLIGLSRGTVKLFSSITERPKLSCVFQVAEEYVACTDIEVIPYYDYLPDDKKHLFVATYASGYVRVWNYALGMSLFAMKTGSVTPVWSITEEKIPPPEDSDSNASSYYSIPSSGANGSIGAQSSTYTYASGSSSTSSHRHQFQPLNQIMCCSVSADGLRFVTAGDDCVIRVYEIELGMPAAQSGATGNTAATAALPAPPFAKVVQLCGSSHSPDKMDGHAMRICAIKYHPRGSAVSNYAHVFISGGWDDTVQIWDDRFPKSLWVYAGPHLCGTDALDIDMDSNHVVMSSWKRQKAILQVWRFNEEAVEEYWTKNEVLSANVNNNPTMRSKYGKPMSVLNQDSNSSPSMGYVAQWLGNTHIIFAGSNQNMLKVIDRVSLNTVASVTNLPNGVFSVSASQTANDTANATPDKKAIRLSFAMGNKLVICKVDRK